MKNLIFTLGFTFLALTSINAQSNFRPGYVITNEKDTISGLIDFRTYKMNAQFCKFRSPDMSEEKIYYPNDIYGYRFTDDGKYYVSKDIEIEGKKEKVFLEYLVQGIISLYFYPAEESDYYFFQDEFGKMIPVTKQDKKYVPDTKNTMIGGTHTSGRYNLEDDRYKGIVRYIFKGSESVSNAALKMSFKQNEMIDLTKKYHADVCTTGEECIVFTAKPDKYVKTKVSVYTGLQMQTFKIGNRYFDANREYKIQNIPSSLRSMSPVIGMQVNFFTPRWNKSLCFLIDVSLAQFKDDREIEISPLKYSRLKADGFMTPVKLGGKYTYPKGSFRPVVEGGFMVNVWFVSSHFYQGFKYSSGSYDYEQDEILYSSWSMPGFYAGTGFDYQLKKDNALLFRVVYDNCMEMYNKDMMTTWQLKLGYTF